MGQIVRRKKKGRPSKADLARRSSQSPATTQSDLRRSRRRRNVRYPIIDFDDYLDEDEEEEEDEDERRREKKKLKLVEKLNQGVDEEEDEDDDEEDLKTSRGRSRVVHAPEVKKRKNGRKSVDRVDDDEEEEENEEEREEEEEIVEEDNENAEEHEDDEEEGEADRGEVCETSLALTLLIEGVFVSVCDYIQLINFLKWITGVMFGVVYVCALCPESVSVSPHKIEK